MQKITFSLVVLGLVLFTQGCASQSSPCTKEMQCANSLISVNTNKLCSVCSDAITQQYPDIKSDTLNLKNISYNCERTKPLSVTFLIVDADKNQSEADGNSHEIGVILNADGTEPMVMQMNTKTTVTPGSNGQQTYRVNITSE